MKIKFWKANLTVSYPRNKRQHAKGAKYLDNIPDKKPFPFFPTKSNQMDLSHGSKNISNLPELWGPWTYVFSKFLKPFQILCFWYK